MKQFKYVLALILSVLVITVPIAVVAVGIYFYMQTEQLWVLGVAAGIAILCFMLNGVVRELRVDAREASQTNEYGEKKLSQYKYLSQKEKEQVDLIKTATRENIMSSSALKKMIQQGPKDPMKELQGLIGLRDVKDSVEEMVARMKFESEERKKKKGSKAPLGVHHMCFTGSPGTGKAQPLYSKVLTPTGFVRMGDIKVGDTVLAHDGKPSKVLGVFPQGIKKIYEITLSDGSKCRCSDEHLWQVQSRSDRNENTYRIIQTKDMLDNIYCKREPGRLNYSIQTVSDIDLQHKEFFIHPYVLGALIGDGCFRQKGDVTFTNKDEEILNKFISLLPDGLTLRKMGRSDRRYEHRIKLVVDNEENRQVKQKFLSELERLGLIGTYSYDKFIPEEYLYASYEQRLELLRGLMDTDGTIDIHSAVSYTTTSERLAKDIAILVRSFGGSARTKNNPAGYKNVFGDFIQCRETYDVSICMTSDSVVPFSLTRKVKRITPNRFKHKFITAINYVGDEECQCIYIDHPDHLYVTDDFIVTHNTTVARIMTSFLFEYGYIKENKCIEIDGNFLKAGTDSAAKTELVMREALGGVLFIDEAYSLMDSSDNSGEQVIATLIKLMEDKRDQFVLILAGYTNEMRHLISMNPGFESRIKDYLHFPDYDAAEMREILQFMAGKQNFAVGADAYATFDAIVERERKLQSFGNARTVRNILEKAIDKHALNIMRNIIGPEDRYKLRDADFRNLKLGGIAAGMEGLR